MKIINNNFCFVIGYPRELKVSRSPLEIDYSAQPHNCLYDYSKGDYQFLCQTDKKIFWTIPLSYSQSVIYQAYTFKDVDEVIKFLLKVESAKEEIATDKWVIISWGYQNPRYYFPINYFKHFYKNEINDIKKSKNNYFIM